MELLSVVPMHTSHSFPVYKKPTVVAMCQSGAHADERKQLCQIEVLFRMTQ